MIRDYAEKIKTWQFAINSITLQTFATISRRRLALSQGPVTTSHNATVVSKIKRRQTCEKVYARSVILQTSICANIHIDLHVSSLQQVSVTIVYKNSQQCQIQEARLRRNFFRLQMDSVRFKYRAPKPSPKYISDKYHYKYYIIGLVIIRPVI